MSEEPKIDWNIELNFDALVPKVAPPPPPPPPKLPPRDVLGQKFPRILDKITSSWGTVALHRYFQDILTTDRSDRQGFPPDVMDALSQLHHEHQRLLMKQGLIRVDVWDMQFGDSFTGKNGQK